MRQKEMRIMKYRVWRIGKAAAASEKRRAGNISSMPRRRWEKFGIER